METTEQTQKAATANSPSTSETGHLKNVTRFDSLISFVTGYGAAYNPSNAAIKIPALTTQRTAAEQALLLLKTTETPLTNARGARKTLFAPLQPLSTRIIAILKSSGAPDTNIKAAETINWKIQGTRAPVKAKKDGEVPNTISASQQSYDRQADYFQELIKLLETTTQYNPNEADLKTVALNTYQQQLIAANKLVTTVYTPYSNSISRDKILYDSETGLIAIVQDIKNYVKALFGASSAQYGQVRGIQFKKP